MQNDEFTELSEEVERKYRVLAKIITKADYIGGLS